MSRAGLISLAVTAGLLLTIIPLTIVAIGLLAAAALPVLGRPVRAYLVRCAP